MIGIYQQVSRERPRRGPTRATYTHCPFTAPAPYVAWTHFCVDITCRHTWDAAVRGGWPEWEVTCEIQARQLERREVPILPAAANTLYIFNILRLPESQRTFSTCRMTEPCHINHVGAEIRVRGQPWSELAKMDTEVCISVG